MPRIANHNGELFRINTEINAIEYSANDGRTWTTRYISNTIGRFIQIIDFNDKLYACTSKGLYQSSNRGRNWTPVYTGKLIGVFDSIYEMGEALWAKTNKGLFFSNDGGKVWLPKLE